MARQKMKVRVLIAKIGLDGHDRGAKVISRALRDAGMEVIYTGLKKTPRDIARIAIEEDVDLIGISILSAAHETLLPELCQLLKESDGGDIKVIAGGIIPKNDIPPLKELGVQAVFGPGTKTEEIVQFIKTLIE